MLVAAKHVRSPEDLVKAGLVDSVIPELQSVAAQFSVSITPAMAELIDPQDSHDPIAAQFVPSVAELQINAGESTDPIGDHPHSPVAGIVHRYPDRVLLKLLHDCAVHCRFCFRRQQVGQSGTTLKPEELEQALAYIRQHTEIWEVILSGGDPLVLSNRRIAEVMQALDAIEHVKVVRIHTRVPVVDPQRITDELIAALKCSKAVYVLLHCNHAKELTTAARTACARLIDAGIPMLSQGVLLRGVNDDPCSLQDLMRAFVENRIKPHYLHHGDLACGTGRFRISIGEGQELLRGMRGHLSGLCQPTYILDIPGGYGKIPIGYVHLKPDGDSYTDEDFNGELHAYQDI